MQVDIQKVAKSLARTTGIRIVALDIVAGNRRVARLWRIYRQPSISIADQSSSSHLEIRCNGEATWKIVAGADGSTQLIALGLGPEF